MELAFTITNYVLATILAGLLGLWLYFLGYMIMSFRQSPKLESFDRAASKGFPKVTVILPARNEERYVARCLDTLLAQDYPDLQIIAVNDSSTDRTGEIMQSYAAKDSRVAYVNAPPKPDDWAGKNWACFQGYLRAKSDLLLFTDADTEHSASAMSLAVGHLLSQHLDALTTVPRLICVNFWTRITLPALAIFLHTRFSPLRVNNPNVKTGYFFGAFFVISRKAYEAVGTHEGVRQELVEDGALGGKVKAAKFKMKMVRGERHVHAVWARDFESLWNGLRRLVIPLYHQDRNSAFLIMLAVFFILFVPFLLLPYSLLASGLAGDISSELLVVMQLTTVAVVIGATAVQCALGVFESPAYALASPLSGAIVSFGFMSAIADAGKRDSVSWRDRRYTVHEHQNPIR
jgi:cellulose synthase/poly-beta-1,6-N-acetylglucosamine synthase-like glycosyltransferase